MPFNALGLAEPITRSLAEKKYTVPTPIQTEAIPIVLSGRDLIGIAQTGTGKTAAFALPILGLLAKDPKRPRPKSCRVLVLSPTRELSAQITDSFRTYGRHLRVSVTLAIGGTPIGKQIRALSNGVDVLVATPGRLMDLSDSRAVNLDEVSILVLDEADRMLDMGFIRDIRKIVAKLPKKRQTLFFSATMPGEIADLAAEMLVNPARVSVTPPASTVALVDQRIAHVERGDKPAMLADILRGETIERALVFTRTKHGADKVVRALGHSGIDADAIHGNKSQGQRERALAGFRDGRTRVLIATDIAARGIDVVGISHVINYDLPNIPESYVHRIGRTARAGKAGIAISFCSRDEAPFLRDIEKLIRHAIPVVHGTAPAGRHSPVAADAPARGRPRPQGGQRQRQGNGQRRGGGGRGRPVHVRKPGLANGDDIGAVAFMRSSERRPEQTT